MTYRGKIKENRENASDDERTELSTNSDHNSNQHEEVTPSPTSNSPGQVFGPGAASGLNLGKFEILGEKYSCNYQVQSHNWASFFSPARSNRDKAFYSKRDKKSLMFRPLILILLYVISYS